MIATALLALLPTQQTAPVWAPRGTHPYVVSSASMAPGLVETDVVLADRPRGVCGTTRPALGDVVILERDGKPWLRRVVASAGQTVQMVDGVLHVDDQPVARELLTSTALPQPMVGESGEVWRETQPGGQSYLTLDFGPGQLLDNTPRQLVPEGHWFLLGDSRDNSVDDRVDGPTADARLCGIVFRVVRSDVPERVGTRP